MQYNEFKKCIEVYGVPAAHRNNCREFRINPMVTTNGYEEVYLPADPASKLSQWMERAFAAYITGGPVGLLKHFTIEESMKLRKPITDLTVAAAAEKKQKGFLKKCEYAQMRGIKITERVEKSRPQAAGVTSAIMALHNGDTERVLAFLTDIVDGNILDSPEELKAEDIEMLYKSPMLCEQFIKRSAKEPSYNREMKEQVRQVMDAGLPFAETLEVLERMEIAHIPNLPEFIGVDPFFAEEYDVDGKHEGGKRVEDGIVIDCEGRTVGIQLWDEEVDENFDAPEHSPSTERVEERFVQMQIKRREDYKAETFMRFMKALNAKRKGLEAYKEYCKQAWPELRERAKTLASKGVSLNLIYQAKKEGLQLLAS